MKSNRSSNPYGKYKNKCGGAIGRYKSRYRANEHQHGKLKQPKQP